MAKLTPKTANELYYALTKQIIEKGDPLFGICGGHQVMALANDVSTYKMPL